MLCLWKRSGELLPKLEGFWRDDGWWLCEQSLIRADKLHSSKKLNAEQLALVETLAIGCHASDRGNPQEGRTSFW